nr:hypothetical protein [Tanacetum cinerariifolium]
MDDTTHDEGEDTVHDDDQPQDSSTPKKDKKNRQNWFTQALRPPTSDLEWNKHQAVTDQPKQPWFKEIDSAAKDPISFNDLMATPIDFSKFVLNRLKINNLTQVILLGPAFNLLKDFIVALRMFTRSLIIKRRLEDLQLGVESYQKKLNIIAPQNTYKEIKFKEPYTPSHKPLGVVYEYLNKKKRVMCADDLYKFSDGTLQTVRDELHHRLMDFHLGYNKEMSLRK